MAYSDEHRIEAVAETKRRQSAKRLYTYKLFARHYVDCGQNGMEAIRKTLPNIKNETLLRLEKGKLLKNPYVWKEVETVRSEALAVIELSVGRMAKEYWYQYDKYKDDPRKWQAASSALGGLGKLLPKQTETTDQTKLPDGGVHIYMPQPLEVGAKMRQPDYTQIPQDLLDVTKDEDADKDTDSDD